MSRSIEFKYVFSNGAKTIAEVYNLDQIECLAEDDTKYHAKKGYKLIVRLQFTGLLDCNGAKIFEGDITEDEEHYLSIIYFNSDDAMFCATDVGGIADLCTPFKVIGNIHQNSELLK